MGRVWGKYVGVCDQYRWGALLFLEQVMETGAGGGDTDKIQRFCRNFGESKQIGNGSHAKHTEC